MADPSEKTTAATWVMLGGILLVAGLLRVWAAQGDLWLDEVWSLNQLALARTLSHITEWLGLFFHDNTHPLNTLYMAIVEDTLGPDAPSMAHRGLAILTGVGAVAMAAAIGWRRSVLEGLVAAAMVALSYPMVHYAGEARGYAPMLFAVLAAFYLMETFLENPTPGRAAGFAAVSLLGLTSHLIFVVVQAGLGLWAMTVLFQRLRSVVPTLARLSILFGVQIVYLTSYGVIALNNMVFGGRAALPISDSIGLAAELSFGFDPIIRGSLAPAIGLVLAGAVWWFYRQGDRVWIFYFFTVFVYPLGFLIIDPTLGTVPRYFIANALLALMAAAHLFSEMLAAKGWVRFIAIMALTSFFIGNALLLDKFYSIGRGNPAGGLKAIAKAQEDSPGGGPARVAGYHQFSVGMMVDFFARSLDLENAIRFVDTGENAKNPAEWYIAGHFFIAPNNKVESPLEWFIKANFTIRPSSPEVVTLTGPSGVMRYELFGVYPHWGLSGDTWAVYRRIN